MIDYIDSDDRINNMLDETKTLKAQLATLTAERDAEKQRADDLAANLENVRTGLRQHFLAQIVCDHDTGQDNPIWACSMVFLGWHPSVGEAVEAWIDHAVAAIAEKDAAP